MHDAHARVAAILTDESIDYEDATREIVELLWTSETEADTSYGYVSDWDTFSDQVVFACCSGHGRPILAIYLKEDLYDLFHDALDEFRTMILVTAHPDGVAVDLFLDLIREGLEDCEYRTNQIVDKIE